MEQFRYHWNMCNTTQTDDCDMCRKESLNTSYQESYSVKETASFTFPGFLVRKRTNGEVVCKNIINSNCSFPSVFLFCLELLTWDDHQCYLLRKHLPGKRLFFFPWTLGGKILLYIDQISIPGSYKDFRQLTKPADKNYFLFLNRYKTWYEKKMKFAFIFSTLPKPAC